APGQVLDRDLTAQQRSDLAKHEAEADGIGRPAAEIEGLPPYPVDRGQHLPVGRNGIRDVKDVAHLLAVAEDDDRPTLQGPDKEMGDPALVLRPELTRAVDTAHPQDSGGNAEGGGIVEHVLIGRAL